MNVTSYVKVSRYEDDLVCTGKYECNFICQGKSIWW